MKTFGKIALIAAMFTVIIAGIVFLSVRFYKNQEENIKYTSEERDLMNNIKRYRSIAYFSPKNTENQLNWADALAELAKIRHDDDLYQESFEKYKRVAELNPRSPVVYNNWGVALSYYANEKFNEKAYAECFAMYKKATQVDPKYILAYENWAYDVYELAEFLKEPKYYRESIRLYKKVAELDSLDASTFNTLGNLFFDLSDITGEKEEQIECAEQYRKAISLDSEKAVYHYNLARILIIIAREDNSLNKNKDVIEGLLLTAESINEGYASYDLASFYSSLNMQDEALKWLKKELEYYEYSHREEFEQEFEKNNDFAEIKDNPQFKKLLDEHFN